MTDPHRALPSAGPVNPTISAGVAHRPVPGSSVRLTGGLLHDWQQRNAAASLPLALRQLEVAGNLDNLRFAVLDDPEGYRGPVFMDSDVYKTLEAISWELGRQADADLADFAAQTTELLAKAQQRDGYLNSCVQVTGSPRYSRLASSHELYCAGHLIQAAVAARRCFDGGALLQVARRFADHLVETFAGGEGGLDGHPIVESALAELYRETGVSAYLELAAQFTDQRGHGRIGDSGFGSRYLQDAVPVRQATALAGHAVRALYLEAGVVDVATETGDAELLAGSAARWEDMVATKTALTGGNGSRHAGESFGDAFELPPDRAYNETCAAIAAMQWSWRLLLATGDSRYADHIERVLYNGFAASVSADGQRFFYVNPLQRRGDHFEEDDPGRRREWFSCACCPPNIMRMIASLGHYLATTTGDTLYLQQIAAAGLRAPLAGGVLELDVATGYPWDGAVEITVRAAPGAECGLAVRLPSWCSGAAVRLGGQPVVPEPGQSGYLVLRRRWQAGDVLSVTLPLTPRLTYPSRRIDALRGSAAVERGPLVYCFEQADQAAGDSVEDLALVAGDCTQRAADLPGVGPTVVIEAAAEHLPPSAGEPAPYLAQPDRSAAGRPARAVAIPYFQWDNRDGRAMRVWLPSGRAGGPVTS